MTNGTPGADWCAKVTTQDTALGATPGEIWVDQSAGTSACAAAPTISNYHKLRVTQAGIYQIAVGWSITSIHDFGIECAPGTVFSFTGSAGFTVDGSALGNGSRRDVIINCIFSGNASVADAVTLNKVVESTFTNLTGMNATATAIHCKGCLENTFISPRSSINNNLGPVSYTTVPTVGLSLDTNGSIQSNVNHIIAPVFEGMASGTGISCVSGINNVITAGTSEANATGLNVASGCVALNVVGTDFESNTTADATLAGPGTVLSGISAFSGTLALVQLTSGATNTVINGGKIFSVTLASGATNSVFTGARFQNITINAGATGTSLINVDYSVNGTGGTLTDSAATTTHIQVRNLFTGVYEADQFNNAKGVITPQIGSIAGALIFATNNGAQVPWSITDTGGASSLVPDTNNSHNIGSSGSRVSTVFTTVLNASANLVVNSGLALTSSNNSPVFEVGVATNDKTYTNTQALTAGAATHTLANSFTYTSSATFGCTCTDQTAAAACKAVPASATTVTLAGTGTDVLWLSCSGH